MESRVGVTKVIARAGAGKTTFIVNAIKQLEAAGKLGGKQGAIVLVFSLMARDDFRRRLAAATDALSANQVMTLHCLAGKLSGSTARSIEFVIWKAVQELEAGNREAVGTKACTKKLKHIFVDEAQDLSPVQFALVEQLRIATGASTLFVGDDRQCIFQFQGSDARLISGLRAAASVSLATNYRSTQEILNVANAIGECAINAHRSDAGALPVLVVKERSQLCDEVVKIARNSLTFGTVAVIGPVKVGKKENMGLQSVRNALEIAGVPTVTHYSLSAEVRGTAQAAVLPAVVNMLTIHAAKGLEFETVVLIDAHHRLQNKLPEEGEAEVHRNLMYVAVTRARSRLFICVSAEGQINPHVDRALHCCRPLVPTQPPPTRGEYRYKSQGTNAVDGVVNVLLSRGNLGALQCLQIGEERKDETGACEDAEIQEILDQCLVKLFALRCLGSDYFGALRSAWENVAIIGDGSGALAQQAVLIDGKEQLHLLRQAGIGSRARARAKGAVLSGRMTLLVHSVREKLAGDIAREISAAFANAARASTQARHRTAETERMDERQRLESGPPVRRSHSQEKRTAALRLQVEVAVDCRHIRECMLHVSKLEMVLRKNAQHLLKEDLSPCVGKLTRASKASGPLKTRFGSGCRFGERFVSEKLAVEGQAHLVTNDAVVEFVRDFGVRSAARLCLKGLAVDPLRAKRRELVNLQTGEVRGVALPADQTRLLIRESMLARKRKIKGALILYDFETTGLDPGSCAVIDRCFYDCDTGVCVSQGLVRAAFVPPEIEQLTGISTQMLERADPPSKFCAELKEMLEIYDTPCLIAHNGARYDDKILLRYMGQSFAEKVRFADSMHFLPVLVKAKTKKLQDLYGALFADQQIQAHRAEADVLMLAKIINHPSVRPEVDKLLDQQFAHH